jgi:predicted DsbA family dithiol-disulfide isomerase
MDVKAMHAGLARRAEEYGLHFEGVDILANSRLAATGVEFARDAGRHLQYTRRMFTAYFSEGRNIGETETVLAVAADVGLDPEALREALAENRYGPRIVAVEEEAHRWGVTGVPTFIVNESHRIVGAQPLAVFRELFERLVGQGQGSPRS